MQAGGVISYLFEATSSSTINMFFFFFMIILIIAYYIYFKEKIIYDMSLPIYLVSLGLLGTFIGIFISLMRFDVNNISGSIPNLLEGLKIAFVTSIWGLIFSSGIRLISIFRDHDKDTELEDQTLKFIDSVESNMTILQEKLNYMIDNMVDRSLFNDRSIEIITAIREPKSFTLAEDLSRKFAQLLDNASRVNIVINRIDQVIDFMEELSRKLEVEDNITKLIGRVDDAAKLIHKIYDKIDMTAHSYLIKMDDTIKELRSLSLSALLERLIEDIELIRQDVHAMCSIMPVVMKDIEKGLLSIEEYNSKYILDHRGSHPSQSTSSIEKQYMDLKGSLLEVSSDIIEIMEEIRGTLDDIVIAVERWVK